MNLVTDPARWRQPYQHLLPLDNRAPRTKEGKHLARRYRVAPGLADLVAQFALLGGERGR